MPISPQNQFLMGMGSGLLSQPYTPHPQGNFAGLGQGLQSGMDAYNNAMILAQAQAEAAAKKKEFEEQAKARAAQQQGMEDYINNLDASDEVKAALRLQAGLDPTALAKTAVDRATPKPLNTSSTRADAEAYVRGVNPNLRPGSPEYAAAVKARMDERALLSTPHPVPPHKAMFGEISSGLARGGIERITGTAQGARDKLTILQQQKAMSDLIEGGGGLEELYTMGQGIASQMGFELGDMTQLGPKEFFKALNFRAVQADRQADAERGAGDGRPSDKDMEIFKMANQSLANSKPGRLVMYEFQTMGERQKIADEEALFAFAQDFEANGYDPDSALVAAEREMRKIQNQRAKEQKHMLLNNEENGLSPLGQKISQISGIPPEELLAAAQGKENGASGSAPSREPGWTMGKQGNKTFRKNAAGKVQEWVNGRWVDRQ